MSVVGGERVVTGASAASECFARVDPPDFGVILRPHRSLTRSGSAWLIGATTAGLSLPLLALGGSLAGWGLLPFLLMPVIALYLALRRSFEDGRLTEELRLWPDLITVVRREPRGGPPRSWHANPHWVQLRLREDARVEKYLTLRGNGREIELGAFLSPDERVDLYHALVEALRGIGSTNLVRRLPSST